MYYFIRHVFTGLGILCCYPQANAQLKPFPTTPRHYTCYQAGSAITIDGKPDEAAWQQAAWSEDFTDIEGNAKPAPAFRTRVKMLWDEQHLYIAAELEDPHIWATLHQHDTIIFQDNDFEVFIDPDGDTHQYYEIEINAHNTVMDLFMPKPYREGGDALMTWDTRGMRTAIHVTGSLNDPSDKDKHWTVEMAIPLQAFSFYSGRKTPADSTLWRINFSRVQWDTDIVNGQYVKRRNKATGKPLPENNWVWSQQGIINMHAPEMWGYLLFVKKPAGSTAGSFQLPGIEKAKQYLWQVYYQQRRYLQEHGRYAPTLKALGIEDATVRDAGKTYILQMESISRQFTATIHDQQSKESCSINQEGKISQKQLK